MQPVIDNQDQRLAALEKWASRELGQPVSGVPASSDASFRRYFRFRVDDRSIIGMDAPPEQEDSRPFVEVAKLFADAGVHVPEIIACDLQQGFMLLSDLGSRTWLQVLNENNAGERFPRAIDALISIQLASRPGVLPDYDEALLRRELELFPEWYIERHLGLTISPAMHTRLAALYSLLLDNALTQPRVYVHRDYMPRNLMDSDPDPGVIDFQDAVYGPVSYDPVCLFRDAFVSWPEKQVDAWLALYHERALAAGVPVAGNFQRFLHQADLMGVQRHLKVIGIFARICHRDGKPQYLEDVPRFFTYLRQAIARHSELAPLAAILSEIGEQ